jgi:ketosteroid isomerase-like protein
MSGHSTAIQRGVTRREGRPGGNAPDRPSGPAEFADSGARLRHDRAEGSMCNQNEWIVREAFLAYDRGDVARVMEFVDPDLEWTYFEPGLDGARPQVCGGREELERVVRRQIERGLRSELEEVVAAGDQVIVVMRTPGLNEYRDQQGDERTYDVVTMRDGLIVGLHACRDRGEARSLAGIS